jgi:hypothetical protein
MRHIKVLALFVIALLIVLLSWFMSETKDDRCAEYCYPNQSGLMDTGTCACWGYRIEIIDMEDVP